MLSWPLLFVGLFVAGWLFGRRRRGRSPPSGSGRRGIALLGWAVLVLAVGLPTGALLLAKLFESDVLGWVFGLSLMAELALLPCLAAVVVGYAAGSRVGLPGALNKSADDTPPAAEWPRPEVPVTLQVTLHKPDEAPADPASSLPASGAAAPLRRYAAAASDRPLPLMALRVDRDSVHAGDDTEPHAQTFMVEPGGTLAAFLHQLRRSGYLPGISGGEATWVVESAIGASERRPVAVCAQQWSEARLMPAVDRSTTLADLFGNGAAGTLHFRYWCQVDPALKMARLLHESRVHRAHDRCSADAKEL